MYRFLFKQFWWQAFLCFCLIMSVIATNILNVGKRNLAMIHLTDLIQTSISPVASSRFPFKTGQLPSWFAHIPTTHITGADVDFTKPNLSSQDLIAFFFASGDQALRLRLYQKALTYYRIGWNYSDIHSFNQCFKTAISAVLSNSSDALLWLKTAQSCDSSFQFYTLQNKLKIEGGNFRHIKSASNSVSGELIANPENDDNSGILWTNGQALVVVSVIQTGSYNLQLSLRNRGTPPIIAEVGVDERPVRTISLNRGDNSWDTFEIPLVLEHGFHTLNIWFLNDIFNEHESRDLELAWITLQKQN